MLKKKMFRDIKQNLSQFITIFLMVLIGVMVYVGIKAYMDGMTSAADNFYKNNNIQDLNVMGNLSDKDLDKIKSLDNVKDAEKKLVVNAIDKDDKDKTYLLSFIDSNNISKFHIMDGEKFDVNKKGAWVDNFYAEKNNLKVGETIKIKYDTFSLEEKILGLINVPDHIYDVKDESEFVPNRENFGFVYLSVNEIPESYIKDLVMKEMKITDEKIFDKYVKDLEEKRSEELGKKFVFSEDEKESMLLQYQVKENHYITDYALDFKGVGQVGDFDAKYYTDTSNQLSTMITTPKNILEGRGIRGQVAIGFSKETLNPELIATISSTNINSNKGIDYVESDNQFKDFSVSYDELSGDKKSFKDNTEVVLFRNSYESSLKPSYVMYVGNDKLDSETEKANIENVKKQMSEAGLKVPLVIFDRYAIKENIKSLEQNKKEDKEER